MRSALIVCTANVCRSPVAAALLARRLGYVVDTDGQSWIVRSAGIGAFDAPLDRDTLAAAAALDLDLSQHQPQPVDAAMLAEADLVVTMTREHVRALVAADASVWSKTFPLRELVQRATACSSVRNEGYVAWLAAVGEGRKAADLLQASDADDVADPYGRGRRANVAMVETVQRLVGELVRWGPWIPSG